MKLRAFVLLAALAVAARADLVADIRACNARQDFPEAKRILGQFVAAHGWNPEAILGLSWIARGAQAAKQWDKADAFASETRTKVMEALKGRKLDSEPMLATALGASIEVQGHTLAGLGRRAEAVAFLRGEAKRWAGTSIVARTNKNLHLLSLEGQPAPALEISRHLGSKPVSLASLKGKPVLLYFWAHWCEDCKYQAPIMARLRDEFQSKGLVVVGPTQRYGYVANGAEAPPEEETKYIEQVRQRHYGALAGMAVPVSEANFQNWGCSSTPTLALVDRQGIVRMYHPGKMTYEELQPLVAKAAN